MKDLKKLEGKTIKYIHQDNSSANSYLIIKFEDDWKINITSTANGNEGVGQLHIETSSKNLEDFMGKTIKIITEEFDGEDDFIILNFKDGSKMVISSFSSSENTTASLDTFLYAGDKIVKESLDDSLNSDTAQDWQKIHLLVFERTESGYIQDEDELQLVINTLIGLKNRGVYNISKEDIKDAAWTGYEDAKYNVNENEYSKRGKYPLSRIQYENTLKDNTQKAKRLEQWSKAAEIFTDLEEWLNKHQIHDQDEELDEIESWLDINLEDEDEMVIDKVLELVRDKYNIE